MKLQNFTPLIKSSAKSHKLASTIFSVFIVISTVIILTLISITFPLSNNLESNINNHVFKREFVISFSSETTDDNISDAIKKIENIKNVVEVYRKPENLTTTEQSGILSSEYTLDFIHNGYKSNIVSGRVFDENETGVALVPEFITDFNRVDNKMKKINGSELIGTKLIFSYGNNENYTAEVIGTYNTTDPIYSGTEIIIPQQDLLKLSETNTDYYIVSVDNYKNTDKVFNEVSSFCTAEKEQTLKLDAESYNIAIVLLFSVLGIFTAMIISAMFMFLKNNVNNRTNELALYRALGYKSKQIFYIIFTEHLLLGIISITIGIILTAIFNTLIINPYLFTLVGNTIMDFTVTITALQVLFIFIFFIAILSVVCQRAVKRSEKIDLTVLLRER